MVFTRHLSFKLTCMHHYYEASYAPWCWGTMCPQSLSASPFLVVLLNINPGKPCESPENTEAGLKQC
eukprot:scaffold313000_cov43-Prasinocladus_malaysianus.AAC.1